MKILHICTGAPLSFNGGITNYVRSLANKQQKLGNDVVVLGGFDALKSNYSFRYIEYKSHIIPFSLKYERDKESLSVIRSLIQKENFDIIHIHMMLDIDFDLYQIIKNENYIISLHDYFYLCPRIFMIDKHRKLCTEFNKNKCCNCIGILDQNYFLHRVSKKLNFKLPSINSKMAYKRYLNAKQLLESANCLLPVSNRVKEIYSNSNILGDYKVLHIGNITAEHFDNYKANINNLPIKVGIIGTLNYIKGAEVILKIVKQVNNPNIEFHFYGRADKKYISKLKKYGLIFHGSYKQKELKNILKNINIGLNVPVWEDNGPQVVMEMLNNCIPIIATKMGGITDFITFNNGYIFNPYSELEISEAIQYINNLKFDTINKLKSNIKRTKTPLEHSNEILKIYNTIIGSNL
ncbi:glycosyltransferase [Clostridium tyrobutyricum]|uniref:glycosyltransferase n=1 Tax=Clostridium tyrobutyricum TaxID=1519 RepID=UPI00242BE6CA|nr:glycosyltransferase [Clostridium tyrobutyricum]